MVTLSSSLGIDIKGDDLVLASVKRSVNRFRVASHETIENFQTLDKAELKDRLQKFVRRNGHRRDQMVLGIPREQTVLRLLEFPLEVEENLRQVIQFQVENFEPSEEVSSYYDFVVLKKDTERKKIHVLVSLVKKSILDQYLQLFRDVRLYPASVQVSTSALLHLLMIHAGGLPLKSPYVILDINPQSTEILVVHHRSLLYSKEVPRPADQLKVDELMAQVHQLFSEATLEDMEIERMYFTGAAARPFYEQFKAQYPDCEWLADRLNLVMTPAIRAEAGTIANSVGHAITRLNRKAVARLNLIPQEQRQVRTKVSWVPTVVILAALLVAGALYINRGTYQEGLYADSLQGEINALNPRVKEVEGYRSQADTFQKKVIELEGIVDHRELILDVLRELTEKFPSDSYISNLIIQDYNVNITGVSSNASALLPLLTASKYFKKIESVYINRDPRADIDRFNFKAEIKDEWR